MLKKIIVFLVVIIPIITIHSSSSSQQTITRYTTYSHGWGERYPENTARFLGPISQANSFQPAQHWIKEEGKPNILINYTGPVYPQGMLDFTFYGKTAVIKLIESLKDTLSPNGALYLVGRSCGSGIILNALALLHNYDDFSTYFEGTGISKEDAQNIVEAINKGRVELTVPMLSLDKTILFKQASNLLAKMTLFIGSLIISSRIARALGKSPTWLQAGCFGALGMAATSCLFGEMLKKRWGHAIDKTILPIVSLGTYDPEHLKPINAYNLLKGKLKCPVTIQVCQSDGVVDNTIDDIAELYLALAEDNKENTFLHVSKGNACHNVPCPMYNEMRLNESNPQFARPKSKEEVENLFDKH